MATLSVHLRRALVRATLGLLCSAMPGVVGRTSGAVFNIADGDVAGLIAAMDAANQNRADDTINLAPGGTYVLSTSIDGANGLPPIGYDGQSSGFHSLTINGNGATITRSTAAGTPEFRLLAVYNRAPGAVCTVTGVSFTNGRLMSDTGGGIDAVANLVLIACNISGCSALRGGGVASANGRIELRQCAIFGNNSDSVGGGFANGPEFNTSADAILINCTLAGNTARAKGAAISNDGNYVSGRGGASVQLTHCTVQGGAIYNNSFNNSGVVTFDNTILDRAPLELVSNPGNLANKFVSAGHNLSSDGAGGYLTGPGDILNAAPHLDPLGLRNNGGPTKCLALMAGGPAIDRGTAAGTATDQRGYTRPLDILAVPNSPDGDGSDIGAYEDAGDPVQESPLVVNSLDDHDDGVAGASDCTLREAIARANALRAAVISFAPGLVGTISLNRALGPLGLNSSVTIHGPGARALAVSGDGYIRVFTVAAGNVAMYGLTIRDGAQIFGNVGDSSEGGGIHNSQGARLELTDCALIHHVALGQIGPSGGGAGGFARGAGIFNRGELAITRCTFTGCVAGGGAGTDNGAVVGFGGAGGAAEGAALYNAESGVVAIVDSTIAGNSASGGIGGSARFGGRGGNGTGAAVHNLGSLVVNNSTMSKNYGGGGGGGGGIGPGNAGVSGLGNGGVFNAGSATFFSVLCAGNQAAGYSAAIDVSGPFVSQGFNLLGSADGSTGFTAADQFGTAAAPIDALLGPLQNNGGDTDTLLPSPASPAIDRGHASASGVDQRGLVRPLDAPGIANAPDGDGSEVGSVEVETAQPGNHFEVTTTDDHDDGLAGYYDCTLREAIAAAARVVGPPASISFRPGLQGTVTLQPALGTLVISNSMAIVGPGARHLAIDGGGAMTIFRVTGGTSVIAQVSLNHGRARGTSSARDARGGAIQNEATLTVTDCSFGGSTSAGFSGGLTGNGGGSAFGGAVANSSGGSLTVRRSAFVGNSATGGDGPVTSRLGRVGGGAAGAAVFNAALATLVVESSSFYGNTAQGGVGGSGLLGAGAGGAALGGAIANLGNATLTAITASGNRASGGLGGDADVPARPGVSLGGGLAASGGIQVTRVRNSIVAANAGSDVDGPDVFGSFASEGFNLIGDATAASGFGAVADQTGTAAAPLDAKLGPFTNNGGPTDSFAPLPGSPALDQGQSFGLTWDQRGVSRLFNDPAVADGLQSDGADIGAVESRPAYTGPPVILSIARAGDGVGLWLQGTPGGSYRWQEASDPGGPFVDISNVIAADGLGLVELFDLRRSDRGFYRAVAVGQ